MSEETAKSLPYVHLVEGRDAAEVMRSTPAKLHAIVERLGPAAVNTRPAPGKWSVRELLCHIADCEVAWAWRLRLIYGADNPQVQPFDQDPWARAYDGVQYTAEAALAAFTALRTWNLALIETLSEADKLRPAHHPEIGSITLWAVVKIAAGHDVHHLRALDKLS
ncbi:MAG: DinB family protein [Janthinobacterium lividum]